MSTPSGYRRISVDSSRSREILHVDSFAFAFTVPAKDEDFLDRMMPWDRARAIEVADESRGTPGTLAAVHASFAFGMRIPGGAVVPTSGLTWVGVHPGHRRRGLLRDMIDDHFERSLARGEAISVLIAAETEIYQRFGYGLAVTDCHLELGRGVGLRDIAGSSELHVEVDTASADKHGTIIREVQAQAQRPGMFATLAPQTIADTFMDLEIDRDGAEELRIVIVREGARPVAWALFQRKLDWTPSGPAGKVRVRTWGALDAKATHRLVSVLCDFDLMSTTSMGSFASDDPFLTLLKDIRGAKVAVKDKLWLRILDVKAALEARTYSADADLALAITDDQLEANARTWRATITNGAAIVSATTDAPDLTIAAQELGAAYLGGTSIIQLHGAGLVTEHTQGAATALSNAMAGQGQPASNLYF
ncbi:GNAT family N-acetyltransferase [Demequina sp. B12]|uniref:GNAT family N-acetyltransferase n=1 Tax=Demequina sp. B12 TaxID=2992757 RepID=UPI00237B7BEA|nr:GNAT family N-acetyltransferase [Demequina sp. B12]MDE0573512.1 GNAT family N-acetyltransferase [Demequina sp. B12]